MDTIFNFGNKYCLSVDPTEIYGTYAIKPYKFTKGGIVNFSYDTILLHKNGRLSRYCFLNDSLCMFLSDGRWEYIGIDNRFSIGTKGYSNDVLPQKSIFSSDDIKIEIGSHWYYKLSNDLLDFPTYFVDSVTEIQMEGQVPD